MPAPLLRLGATLCGKNSTVDHASHQPAKPSCGHPVESPPCRCNSPVKVASGPGENWVKNIGGAPCAAMRPYSVVFGSVSLSDGSRRRSLRSQDHQHHRPSSCAGQSVFTMLSSYTLQIRGVMVASRSRAILATATGTQLTLRAGWALSSPCWV